MRVFIFSVLFGAGSALAAADVCIDEHVTGGIRQNWARNVVAIDGNGSGAGFVVGWSANQVWIATAAHVAYGGGWKDIPLLQFGQAKRDMLPKLQIRFAGESELATLCPDEEQKLIEVGVDLAFVCVRPSGLRFFPNNVVARRNASGDTLILLARSDWGSESPIGSLSDAGGEAFALTGLAGIPGQSGAMVVGPRGVIGMYMGQDGNGAAQSISKIKQQAQKVRVPWLLGEFESFDCDHNRRVCLKLHEDSVPAASVALRRLAGNMRVRFEPGGCMRVPEGRYELTALDRSLSCGASVVRVLSDEPDLEVPAKCSIQLGGEWQSTAGVLTCVDQGIGAAECVGLAQLGFGGFTGRFFASRSNVSVSGSFSSGGVATGTLAWSNGKLTGRIGQNGSFMPITLTRSEGQQ